MKNKIVTKDNVKIGDKVVRGRDWQWGNQDKCSVYGVIDSAAYESGKTLWIYVKWVDYKGITIIRRNYRTGPSYYDLYFY